jgi:hypothetical protein
MNNLTGMIRGLDRVNLLSGRIWRYRVGFGSVTWCAPMNPLGHGADRLGHAGHARGGGRLGRAEVSAQKLNSNKKFFFFFKSVL